MASFTQVSPPKPCIPLFSPPYALHVPPISFFSILSPEQAWWVVRIIIIIIIIIIRYIKGDILLQI